MHYAALRLHQVTTGTGVKASRWAVPSLETTKSGGLRVDEVPVEFDFEARSPKYNPLLVLGLFDTNDTYLGNFEPLIGNFSDIWWR